MARKSHEDALGVAGAETIIGTGVIVHGNLTSESDITIDGTLEGTITTSGNVVIGVNAQIRANVIATNATVAGTLTGNIRAEGEANILETGRVEGDIRAAGLAIASGGVFIGRSIMEAPPSLEQGSLEDSDTPNTSPVVPETTRAARKSNHTKEG